MIIQIARGRNWARYVMLLFALIWLQDLDLYRSYPVWQFGLLLANHAIRVIALWLMFTGPGALWFDRMRQRKEDRKQAEVRRLATYVTALLVLAFIGVSVAFLKHRLDGLDDKIMTLAREIQQRCDRDRACPSSLDGWEKVADGHFRNGGYNYLPSDDNKIFHLYYHYGPDWDVWTDGGVGKVLQGPRPRP